MERSVLCVHAHPDDEVLFTGGLLASTSASGAETTVITCTDGRWGYAPGHIEVGHHDHDPFATARQRSQDLHASAGVLGIDRVIELQHFDSGMRGWEVNTWPQAFANQPVEGVAAEIAAVIDEVAPDLVVTYDRFGVYGHPDHLQAYKVTVAALKLATHQPDFEVVTVSPSTAKKMTAALVDDTGIVPQWLLDMGEFGTPDEELVRVLDVSQWLPTKRAALEAHASQVDNHFFLALDDRAFSVMLGTERFARG